MGKKSPIFDVKLALGYEVKGEVGAADMVAVPRTKALMKTTPDPVIIELKTGFTLSLFHPAKNESPQNEALVRI